jgi:ubiquinone/menaquinone biosynthesis C-methylase UbiE
MAITTLAEVAGSDFMMLSTLGPAARAFDAIATEFDARFTPWQSVAAQRRAVRAVLIREFPQSGKLLEIGGGTGLDAAFLAKRGFTVTLTDPSPTMVSIAREKLIPFGSSAEVADAEQLHEFATRHLDAGFDQFDGAFSNFAPLNCVVNLTETALGLARLLKPGAAAMLVVFGTSCPGEIVTEVLRGRPQYALRRFKRSPVQARLANKEFQVVYHRASAMRRAFDPWFHLERRYGIGVAVPTSAAEPWISHSPRLLAAMEGFDRVFGQPLAILGDHILYQFRRTKTKA